MMFGKHFAYPVKGLEPQFNPSFCHVVSTRGKLASDNGIVEDTAVDLTTAWLRRTRTRLRITIAIRSSAPFIAIRLRLRPVKRLQLLFRNMKIPGPNQ